MAPVLGEAPGAYVGAERSGVRVALFVRAFAAAEHIDASVTSRSLANQMLDRLGLNATGLRGNRWIIEPAAPAASSSTRSKVAAQMRTSSNRARLVVVPDASA